MAVKVPLNILYLEKSSEHVALVRQLLTNKGIDCEITAVDGSDDFSSALKQQPFDLILADFALSSSNGFSALALSGKEAPEIPFIVLSDIPGEEVAVECLKKGATDYVLKARLSPLVPAVMRALSQAEQRLVRRLETKVLQDSEQQYRDLYQNAPCAYLTIRINDGSILRCNSAALKLFGYDLETMRLMKIYDLHDNSPQGIAKVAAILETLQTADVINDLELEIIRKGGDPVWVNLSAISLKNLDGKVYKTRLMMIDISARKRAEEALKKSEEKYRNLYESSKDGIFTADIDGNIRDMNQAYLDMLGYSKEEVCRMSLSELTPSRWHQTDQDIMEQQILTRGYSDEYEKEFITKQRTTFPVSMRMWLIDKGQGDTKGMWGIARDITVRKRLEEKLRKLSLLDELTSLYNRRGFFTLGEQQWRVAKRTERMMTLLFADLDNMKQINDTLGHQVGDQALKEAAGVLKKTFRESDIVARIGGDEFVVLSMHDSVDDNNTIIGRLQKNLDDINKTRVHQYRLSLSLGIVNSHPKENCSLLELVSRADQHMYQQKNRKEGLY